MVARRRLAVVIGAVVAAAVLVAVGVLLALPAPSHGQDCTASPGRNFPNPQTLVLIPCPSSTDLAGNSYFALTVPLLSDGEILGGQFVSNLSISAYLLNGSEFSALESNPHPTAPPPAYAWTSGNVTEANLSVEILTSPASSHFVLENLNAPAVTVSWTKTLTLFYKSY